ncbi:spondin domain-containing protein [Geojedonia litorea]|uniref:Spondin domain-containing protein n=1 Tax=Geojedonia litorea TaxID=1268269 RepID=A0ABV9N173_9FLAO
MKKRMFIIPLMAVLIWSCSNDSETLNEAFNTANSSAIKANSNNAFTKFKVTIHNLGGSQAYPNVLSPGIYVVQKKNTAPLFMPGYADYGEGLEAIAEDGNPGMLVSSLENDSEVRSHGAFTTPVGGGGPAPAFPGDSYEFYVTAKYGDYLNFATMFVQSNDLFIGPSAMGLALFNDKKDPISGDITMYMELWDAGTEVNEEPGVGPNQAPRQSGPDTGVDENGVVQLVDDGYSYPNLSDIVQITITPMY